MFVPSANGPWNAAGILERVDAQGIVGQIQGILVVADANMPIQAGSEDTVLVGRFSDAVLFESGPRAQVFFAPYANQLSVLLSVWGYSAFALRYDQSFVAIGGFWSSTWGS